MNILFQIKHINATRLDNAIYYIVNDSEYKLGLSRTKIQQLIKSSLVRVNTVTSNQPSKKVFEDDVIEITIPKNQDTNSVIYSPLNLNFNLLYDDHYLAVIDKPHGISMHLGTSVNEITIINGLAHLFKDHLSSLYPERPGIVHRLDKDTSGCLLIAKDNDTHQLLENMFKDRKIVKEYTAFTWGIPKSYDFYLRTQIGRHPTNRQKMTVLDSGGKEAFTKFKVIKCYKDIATKFLCTIETGRTHQIRVHATHNHTPIIGDQTYSRSRSAKKNLPDLLTHFSRQALHASRLSFKHPITREVIDIFSALPKDLQQLEKTLNELV